MKMLWKLLLSAVVFANAAQAQTAQNPTFDLNPQTVPLWSGGAPGALGQTEDDQPTLTIYRPASGQSNGTAVVVAPGGAYYMLAMNHEGRQVANWLNSLGVTAFVVKYRLGPKYHYPVELQDAQRAIRLVRSRAKEFAIDPNRVGIMGFSAGGHLAAMTATRFDDVSAAVNDSETRGVSSRPDFAILGYPVITLRSPFTHVGSRTNLLGENPDPKQVDDLSNELHVTANTPPTFLFATEADDAVPVENSLMFYAALRKAGVAAEMHIFEKGRHGVGLDLQDPVLGMWPALLANWMRSRGLLPIPAAR